MLSLLIFIITVTAPENNKKFFPYFMNARLSGRQASGHKGGNVITGVVTDTGGSPVAGVNVVAFDVQQGFWTQDSAIFDASGSDGKYSLEGLDDGTYKIMACTWVVPNSYINTYYNDKLNWIDADTIYVSAYDSVSGIDFTLRQGAKITGVVSRLDNSYGAGIYAIDVNSGDIRSILECDVDAPYVLGGLPAGTLKILMVPMDDYHSFEWYNNKDDWTGADSITIATLNDSIVGINFEGDTSGYINGNIYSADSVPIMDFEIEACIYWGPLLGWEGPYESYFSGMNDYTYSGIRTGAYKVRVQADGYCTTWYDGKTDTAEADWVNVSAPDTTKEINFYLQKSGIEESSEFRVQSSELKIYPNPFTIKTSIKFIVQSSELTDKNCQIQIYDITGKSVRNLLTTDHQQLTTAVTWDGKNNEGKKVPAGIYFIKLITCGEESRTTGNYSTTRKLILIK